MQHAGRHGPTGNLQPAENAVEPAQVELPLDTACDVSARRGQVVGLGAIGRGQEQVESAVWL